MFTPMIRVTVWGSCKNVAGLFVAGNCLQQVTMPGLVVLQTPLRKYEPSSRLNYFGSPLPGPTWRGDRLFGFPFSGYLKK